MDKIRYCFDIDGTICSTNCEYKDSVPYREVIDWINKKYDEGHSITLFTSRGTSSGVDWFEFTEKVESFTSRCIRWRSSDGVQNAILRGRRKIAAAGS